MVVFVAATLGCNLIAVDNEERVSELSGDSKVVQESQVLLHQLQSRFDHTAAQPGMVGLMEWFDACFHDLAGTYGDENVENAILQLLETDGTLEHPMSLTVRDYLDNLSAAPQERFFTLQIRLEKTKVLLGEDVVAVVNLKNVDSKSITIPDTTLCWACGWERWIINGSPACHPVPKTCNAHGIEREDPTITLLPGQQLRKRFPLYQGQYLQFYWGDDAPGKAVFGKPGKYTVRVELPGLRHIGTDTVSDLQSKEVLFAVVEQL